MKVDVMPFDPMGVTPDGHPRRKTEEEFSYHLRMAARAALDANLVGITTGPVSGIDTVIDCVRTLVEARVAEANTEAEEPPVASTGGEPPAAEAPRQPFITKQIIDAELARRVGDFVITRPMVNTELDLRIGTGWRDLEPSMMAKLRATTHLNLRAEGRRPEAAPKINTALEEAHGRLMADNTRLRQGNTRLHAEWTRVAADRAGLAAALRQVGDIVGSTYLGTLRAHAALGVIGQVARAALWRTQA